MPDSYGSNRYMLSLGEQAKGERLVLTGTTIAANSITKAGWALTADLYTGMRAWVIYGTGAGSTVLHITSNTATVIYTRETLTEATNIDQDSVLVFEIRNQAVTDYATAQGGSTHYPRNVFLAVMEDFEFPTPAIDFEEVWTHNSGQDRNQFVHKKTTMDTSIPIIVQDMRVPFLLFGMEYTTGTDVASGGGSTLAAAIKAGETVFDVASGTGYAAGDYIQVDVTTNAEIRKIVTVATNTITVDFPLRKNHASGVACNEVTSPYTHTITNADEIPGFDLVGVYDEATDFVRDALWCKFTSGEFSSEAGDLLRFSGDIVVSDVITTEAAPSVTAVTTNPYQYRMVTGGISINSITYANVEAFRYRLERNIQTIYTHQATTGAKPWMQIEARRRHELGMTIVPGDTNIYNLLDGSTAVTVTLTFTRTASTDTLAMTFASVYLSAAPHGMVIDGPVRVTATMHPTSLTSIVVVDSIPYYPSGGL